MARQHVDLYGRRAEKGDRRGIASIVRFEAYALWRDLDSRSSRAEADHLNVKRIKDLMHGRRKLELSGTEKGGNQGGPALTFR